MKTQPMTPTTETPEGRHTPGFPHFGCLSIAVFNCTEHGKRKGREAVLKRYGPKGWKKVQDRMKTGIMEIFQHPPTPETRLYANTVGKLAEAKWPQEQARAGGTK